MERKTLVVEPVKFIDRLLRVKLELDLNWLEIQETER